MAPQGNSVSTGVSQANRLMSILSLHGPGKYQVLGTHTHTESLSGSSLESSLEGSCGQVTSTAPTCTVSLVGIIVSLKP